jgi:hypothetical protein
MSHTSSIGAMTGESGAPGEPVVGSLGWKRTEDYITGRFG